MEALESLFPYRDYNYPNQFKYLEKSTCRDLHIPFRKLSLILSDITSNCHFREFQLGGFTKLNWLQYDCLKASETVDIIQLQNYFHLNKEIA